MKKELMIPKLDFKKIFFCFVLGSLLGVFYEEILFIIKHGRWESRRGLIYGPLNPVYGLGMCLVVALLGGKKRKWYITFVCCALLGGSIEYFLSFFQEALFHTRSWFYDGYLLNIHGRTTIPFMICWGLMGTFFMTLLYPKLAILFDKVPNPIYYFLIVFMVFDMGISYIAVSRQVERKHEKEPSNCIEKICDKHFLDEYLKKIYRNARETG